MRRDRDNGETASLLGCGQAIAGVEDLSRLAHYRWSWGLQSRGYKRLDTTE